MIWIIVSILFILLTFLLLCFFMAFYSPTRKKVQTVPRGKIYEEWYDVLQGYADEVAALPCREVEIKAHDGLTLRGKYYEYSPDAPIELMFHGYRGCAESDMTGGVLRSRKLGHSSLIINNRGGGNSDGHVITFGIKESLDVPLWVDFILKEINPDAKIILTGISMGASTVMLASSGPLPKNVIGVLADCGYTSAREIIKKVIKDIHFPKFTYFFVRLSGKLFGGFDVEDANCTNAVSQTMLPVIFFHGDTDAFVPCEMSQKNFDACQSRKRLVIIECAGHGLAYPVNPKKYLEELEDFFALSID